MRLLLLRGTWLWVLFYALAVVDSLLRDGFYVPAWGAMPGRVAGTLILVVVILLVMYIFLRANAARLTRFRLLLLGLLWIGLSLFFEVVVTRWVLEQPWDVIVQHYNMMQGRFYAAVRFIELVGPIVLGSRILSRREAREAADAEASAPSEPPANDMADASPGPADGQSGRDES